MTSAFLVPNGCFAFTWHCLGCETPFLCVSLLASLNFIYGFLFQYQFLCLWWCPLESKDEYRDPNGYFAFSWHCLGCETPFLCVSLLISLSFIYDFLFQYQFLCLWWCPLESKDEDRDPNGCFAFSWHCLGCETPFLFVLLSWSLLVLFMFSYFNISFYVCDDVLWKVRTNIVTFGFF